MVLKNELPYKVFLTFDNDTLCAKFIEKYNHLTCAELRGFLSGKCNDYVGEAAAIIGRMGLPYREKKMNIISIALDAPQDVTSALSGKIGNLPGVSVKMVFAGVKGE